MQLRPGRRGGRRDWWTLDEVDLLVARSGRPGAALGRAESLRVPPQVDTSSWRAAVAAVIDALFDVLREVGIARQHQGR